MSATNPMRLPCPLMVSAVAALLVAAATSPASSEEFPMVKVPPKVALKARPFHLRNVRLLDGPFRDAMLRTQKYLYALESDRLLRFFRVTAGLKSNAKPMGGWESSEVRGHTMGHYLSACAMMVASTGDEKLQAKADAILAEHPDHLLALMVQAEAARAENDQSTVERAERAFLAAFERELAETRQEYVDHRAELESFRNQARVETAN